MAHDRYAPPTAAWHERFPALRLLEALRLAIRFRSLVLAAAGLVVMTGGWWVCGEIFSGASDPALQAEMKGNAAWPWQEAIVQPPPAAQPPGESDGAPEATLEIPVGSLTTLEGWFARSPLLMAWHVITRPFLRMYETGISFPHFIYLLICALWSMAVWSVFGGAITREAAVRFAQDENVSWKQLAGFVLPRWPSYFIGPLFPILGTFMAAVFLAVLGALMRTGVGVLVAGIVWPIVLVAGFLMAFLVIGLFFAWPLMWGAVSSEGTDAFGALSHSYSYAYQRPLHYLFYAVVAALVGVLGWSLVLLFAVWIIDMSNWGISWGSGVERTAEIVNRSDIGSLGNAGAALIQFWNNCVWTLAVAFAFSYLWCSTTVIYFLLRRLVDGTDIDEVNLGEGQEQHGLPPLKNDSRGVPDVADEPTAGDGLEGSPTASA